ncbi:MAG TPA: histidinol-phosphate transaminase [Gammaproteobacteria bacterium]|nr:histidinol-phosphate transaminase [Gammaproteobacteria bacterium]
MIDFKDYCVEGVKALRPYEPGKPIAELERELGISNIIKLASNENPLGPSPKAVAAIRQSLDELALYPDGNAFALKKALSDYHGIEQNCITVGTGSDHILELIARVFLGPGRSAVASRYGFAIYNIVSQAAGAELRLADANPPADSVMPYGHNLDNMTALVDDTTRVVFIANPNNPTGTWLDNDSLTAFLDEIPESIVVVLDEAYFDYVKDSAYPNGAKLLSDYPNLIVMRTFSKAYGLAGVRVGYALASAQLTDLLNRVRLSFNPNSLAQAAATAALDDREHLEKTVDLNTVELEKLDSGLRALGLETIPSVCNFVTVNVKKPGRDVFQAMLQEGVIVRPLDGYGLPEHVRISVGLPEQNTRCLAALKKVLG